MFPFDIDMAVPALARFGSDELKKQFLVPTIAGDVVASIGVSEVGSGSDVASIKTTAVPKKGIIYTVYNIYYTLEKISKLNYVVYENNNYDCCRKVESFTYEFVYSTSY